jgi:hypothetical protein
MANTGYADIFGAIQGQQQGELTQQLTRQQIVEAQQLAGYRQAQTQQLQQQMAAEQQALARQAQAQEVWKRTQGGAPAAPSAAPAGGAAPAAAPGAMGAMGVAPAAPGAAPAAPGAAPAAQTPMAMMDALLDQRAKYAKGLYDAGMVVEGDAAMKDIAPTMQHLAMAAKDQVQTQGEQIKNADAGLKMTQTLSLAIKDKPSFERFKMQMLQSGAPLNPAQQQLVSMPYEQAKPYIDDYLKTSKISLENQRIQAQIGQERAQANASNMRANVEKLTLDRDKRLTDDYKDSVAKMKLAGTPETKIPSFSEWSEGLKHPATKGAAMERARGEQIIGATKELARSINIIADMPITVSGGIFGSRKASTGFFDAPLNTLAGKLTTDAERQYGIVASNLGQAMAIIESGGYKPGQTQINYYQDKLRWVPGDSISTKMLAMADLKAQSRERTDVVLANPAIPDEQKQLIRDVFEKLDKVIPFEPEDIVAAKNKGKSIKEYMQEKSGGKPTTAPAMPSADAIAAEMKRRGL